jgi:hypothetical protein
MENVMDSFRTESPAPIVFTPELLAAAARAPQHDAPLLFRWAALSEDLGGGALRAQIESAAALVPHHQVRRVLGPLLRLGTNDQVRAAVGGLLLAKTLQELGWAVDFEPEIDGGTPDLRITKRDVSFVVEVRRVEAHGAPPVSKALARLQDALSGFETLHPIWIRATQIDGQASLRGFTQFIKSLLSGEPAVGRHSYHRDRVLVVFDVCQRADDPVPAILGWAGGVTFGGQHDVVRVHLNKKLFAYKVPLIVALDFYNSVNPFRTVEDVLLGRQLIQVPIDLSGASDAGEPELTRADDGLVFHPGSDGDRARRRLQGVLPFELVTAADGRYAVRARVLENPIAEGVAGLDAFEPIPRLAVVERTEQHVTMRYGGQGGRALAPEQLAAWQHVPGKDATAR